jgi:transposase
MSPHTDAHGLPTHRPEEALSKEAVRILQAIVDYQEKLTQWVVRMGGRSVEHLDKRLLNEKSALEYGLEEIIITAIQNGLDAHPLVVKQVFQYYASGHRLFFQKATHRLTKTGEPSYRKRMRAVLLVLERRVKQVLTAWEVELAQEIVQRQGQGERLRRIYRSLAEGEHHRMPWSWSKFYRWVKHYGLYDPPEPLFPLWRISDAVWSQIVAILDVYDPPAHTGRPWVDQRAALEAIVYRQLSGCSWNQLPEVFPNDRSIHRTYQRWQERGVLERLWPIIQQEVQAFRDIHWPGKQLTHPLA